MVRPDKPDGFSWTIAALLHLELFLIAAFVMYEEVDCDVSPDPPVVHRAFVQGKLPVPVEEEPSGMFGRWPIKCDHGGPLKRVSIGDDRLGDGLRCEACGWPWWVIRAMGRD